MTVATQSRRPRRLNRLLGSTTLELVFRVQTGEHQGSEVRIRSLKCTIGSAPGCTLRLAARGVKPLHCWILRGAGGTIVRRRDPNTRLNGRPFQDAPLTPGDRLQIGSIELEVCQCPIVPLEWTLENADLPESSAPSDLEYEAAQRASLESAQAAERLKGELHELERRASQQLGELNELVGRVTSERDELSQRLGQLQSTLVGERDQLSQRLKAVEAEATSERDALLLERQQLELSLATNQQQLDELRSHLHGREAEIESVLHSESRRVAEMQDRLEQVARERASLESLLQQQTGSLRNDSEARQSECDRLTAECERLETQLAQLRELVGYTAAERDNLTVQLDGSQMQSADKEHLLAKDKSELERRLETTLSELAESERRLAVLQAEGVQRQSDLAQLTSLQQRFDQSLGDKVELERQLEEQTAAWHAERESLRQQTERVTNHCRQVEGQLTHVRDLVESLASDRDSLCQQLEATEIKLATEQEQWQEQRTVWERQIHELDDRGLDRQRSQDELVARVAAEAARAEQWQRRAEEAEQQLAAASQQVAAASEQFSLLRSESEHRLHDESGRVFQLAQEAAQSREQLSATQVALADAETRLAALQTEFEHRLQTEQERAASAEQRADEVSRELAAADLRLAEAERRLSAFRIEGDSRLNDQIQKSLECERQLTEARQELELLRERESSEAAQATSLRAELDALEAAQQQAKEAVAARWELLQQQIAKGDSRLAEAQSEFEQRIQVEVEQAGAFQRQVAEMEEQLGAARQQQLAMEHRTVELQAQYAMQIAVEQQRAADLEQRFKESETTRTEQESRLLEQTEALRVEHESWDNDRQRLRDECRTLGDRLVEKQQELDALLEQARNADSAPSSDAASVEQLGNAFEEERAAWNLDRERLLQRVAELEQQMVDQRQFSQGMTLGSDALAELRSQSSEEPASADLVELRNQLASVQTELTDALGWRDRFQAAEEQLDQQRTMAQQMADQVELLKEQLRQAEQAALNSASAAEAPALELCEDEQLSELQAFRDQQNSELEKERRQVADEREFLEVVRLELDRERDEFKQSQVEFESQWRAWEASLRSKEQLLNGQAQELADRLERAAARQAEVELERTELVQQRAALAQPMAALAECEAPTATAEPTQEQQSAEAAVLEQPEDLEQSSSLASSQQFETKASDDSPRPSPVGEDDHSLPAQPAESIAQGVQDVEAGAEPELSTPRLSERHKPVWTQPDSPARPADDDSIEAYMARLLKRVRGDAAPAPHPFLPTAPPPSGSAVTVEPGTNHSAPTSASPTPDSEQPATREEFTPRNRAPELTANLAAMRELANSAARTAIVKHQRKSGSQLALAQSIGAVLTLLCSCGAGYIALRNHSQYAGIGAAIGGLAACYWGGKAARHAIKAMLLRLPVVESLVLPVRESKVADGQPGEPAVDAAANPTASDASAKVGGEGSATGDVAESAAS